MRAPDKWGVSPRIRVAENLKGNPTLNTATQHTLSGFFHISAGYAAHRVPHTKDVASP